MSLGLTLFENMPQGLKGVLLGLYSCLNRHRRYGAFYRKELYALRRARADSRAALEILQKSLLTEFLQSVYEENPYYRRMMRRASITIESIRKDPIGSLLKMDVLEKRFLRKNMNELTNPNRRTFSVSYTSGTTGSPMAVAYDKEGNQKGFAYWRRFYDEMGLPERFTNARFSGRVLLQGEGFHQRYWVYDWCEKRLFLSTYHMSQKNLGSYVDKLNIFKPALIDGYPSAIATLARHILETKCKLTFSPVAISTTAETLFDNDRQTIEVAFGCKVFNQYASSEGAPFITECRHSNLHLNLDTGYFEFFDTDYSDDIKELVVTSFRNKKTPLIRYRIGDTVKLPGHNAEAADCPCGSGFPFVKCIEGRVDQIIYSTERGAIGRLDPIYKGITGIDKSQIIQEGKDRFRILVVKGIGYAETTKMELARNFRHRVGSSVDLTIDVVDSIPLSRNGKFIAVLRIDDNA